MAYNKLSGTVIAPDYFGPGDGRPGTNILSGNLSTSDGANIINIPRVSNATDNAIVTNVAGNANTLTCETNLTFDGSSLSVTGHVTASMGVSASYFEGDGSRLTGVAGSGGTIGPAEDGDYTDGLFTDFTSNTLIGVPVDRFNEVLKILAPSPAPGVRSINEQSTDGVSAKLSFGSSFPVAGYTSSATAAGFDAVDRTGTYAASVSGSNIRLGVYSNEQNIVGVINNNVAESISNGYLAYSSGAFGNAETGSLKLELNGTVIHTVNLSSFGGAGDPNTGSATSLNADGSGFTNVSVTASSYDGNGAEWYLFKHRTAKYLMESASMNVGWNYMRVVHTVGATNYATNYIEWINDPSGAVDDLAVARSRIDGISLAGSKYLSGVEYNTNATANYKADILNLYRNVYAASGNPISFSVTNSSTPSAQSVPDIAVGEDNTKILGITASLNVNASVNNLLSGAITANLSATHPLKASISNTGSATTGDGFLVDNRTLASTNLIEYFHDESYRKTSASYSTQNSVDAASSIWNSQNHMTGGGAAGHTDGLLFFNQRLYSPVDADIPVGGNFSALSNVEAGQPDYSAVTGTRTFFRVLTNSSGAGIRDLKITSDKNGTAYSNTTLDADEIRFFIKNPGSTEFMNIRNNFTYGSVGFNDGALINGADDNSNTTGTGASVHCVTFGTASVANGDYVVVKIEADESWSGYLNQLTFQLGASDVSAPTEAPALDDIDANNSGVSDAKLSFGTSNVVASYSAATGSSISLTDFDSNDLYSLSGDRRGVLGSLQNITGELNEDVAASSPNYVANAFKDAYTGSLVLEVNGAEVHTLDLHNLNSVSDDFNANDSGFSVSAVSFSETTDGIPDYRKSYRTGDYQIGTSDQNLGWNYARVIHRIGASDTTTNYVEWVVDTDGNALGSASVQLDNFDHGDVYYQSGIGYFASRPSASYTYEASNVYRNVYQNGTAVSFPTTDNSSISNIRISGSGVATQDTAAASVSLPNLNNTTNCQQKNIQVSGTVLFDSLTSISGGLGLFTDYDVAVASQVIHPLKATLSTTELSKTSFMVYSGTIGSTTTSSAEYFGREIYRIVSGNYANQASVTSVSNKWNSARSVNDTGTYPEHADGMATSNGYLISPFQIGNDGDTRNTADGGLLQAPASNPNYSALTNATRSFYRHFVNDTGLAKSTFKLKLYGDANLVSKSGAFYTGVLANNKNITVELKVPYDPAFSGLDDTSTAWGDAIRPFSSGDQPITDGKGILNLGGSDLNQTVGGTGREIPLQLQARQVRSTQYFVVKISAHKDWTGYLSRIEVDYT